MRSLDIQVDPGGPTAADDEAAEMLRKALHAPAVRTSLIDCMDAVAKGYSVSVIDWKRDGKRLRIAGLELVNPDWFEFDRENGNYLYLRDNAGPQPLDQDRYVIHVAKAKSGLPIRGGLARLAAWGYLFKNYSLKDWAIFLEAYGHPLRLGKYGPSSSPEDRLTLLRAARQIGVDMAAIIPKDMDLEVVTGTGTTSEKLYEGNARYWDEQTSKAVLGQVATTDALSGGHAVGKIHEEVRSDIRDADAEQLAATLSRDLGGAIVRTGFAADHAVALPIVRFVQPERADPKLMLDLMERGPKAGLRIAVSQMREVFALREPEDGEEVLAAPAPDPAPEKTAPPAPLPAPAPVPDASDGKRQAASRTALAARDSIDALVDELVDSGDLQRAAEAELGPLLEALALARTPEEVEDVLQAFADGAPADLHDLLTRATFAARAAGELGADIHGDGH